MYKSVSPNIMTASVADTVAFYTQELGFSVKDIVPDIWVNLVSGGVSLMFQEKNSLIEEYPTLQVDTIQPSLSIFLHVEHIDEIVKQLADKNVVFQKELTLTPYGVKEFAIFDNNGNILTYGGK